MVLRKFFYHIVFLSAMLGFSQTRKNDSIAKLQAILETSKTDSTKYVTLVNIAQQHYLQKEYDSVIQTLKRAGTIQYTLDPKTSIRAHTYLGIAYNYLGSYDRAIRSHLSALKICEENNETPAQVYNNLGMTYIDMKNWVSAENYLNKALEICEKEGIKRGLSYIYGNLGIVYRNQQAYDKALDTYNKSLKINIELNDKEAIARNYNNLGDLFRHKGNREDALAYYEKGLQTSTALNYRSSMASNYISLGGLLTELKEYRKAEDAYENGLQIANELKALRLLRDGYLGMAVLNEYNGQLKKSIHNRKLYEELKDSLMNKDHINEVKKLEIIYETEKKDKKLAEQNLKLEKQQAQNKLMTGLALTLLLTSILIWFLYQQRQKRKNQEILTLKREQQVKTLESLMEGEEKERLRIAKELHDGVNGDLSAIKYKLTAMVEENTKVINEVVQMLDRSSEQVRAISHNLVPPALEKFNLIEALEDYAASMNEIHKPEITFQFLGDPIRLSKDVEVNLYRIVQELVSNAVKHAQASEITIQVSHQQNNLLITVEDDGTGFDSKDIKSKGIGLQNIESRIAYLKGTKDLVSNEKGTTYSVEIDTKSSSTE